MVPTLSRDEERRGTRRVMLGGVVVAIVAFAASLVWLFAVVPHSGLSGRVRGPSVATGLHSNQGSGQSTTAKNDQVMPEPSATARAGQNSNGEAAAIDQGAAPLTLGEQQRQQIASYFAGNKGNRAQQANFALSVGAAVPAQVTLQKLPARISSAMGGYRGDDYVIVGSQLVVVELQRPPGRRYRAGHRMTIDANEALQRRRQR